MMDVQITYDNIPIIDNDIDATEEHIWLISGTDRTQEEVSQKLIEDWNAEIEAGTWLYPEAESQVYYFEPLESTQAPDVCLALDPDF